MHSSQRDHCDQEAGKLVVILSTIPGAGGVGSFERVTLFFGQRNDLHLGIVRVALLVLEQKVMSFDPATHFGILVFVFDVAFFALLISSLDDFFDLL